MDPARLKTAGCPCLLRWLSSHRSPFLFLSRDDALASDIVMAPQLDAAQRSLVKTLLAQGFENQLIASKASCSKRTVQKMRLERPDSEMPTRKPTHVGRRSRMTTRMQKALCDRLIKQPYMYRCEMADFLYRHFATRLSERSIGRILRLIGWTRKTIRRIAQQRDDDLRDHYLHRISQYQSHQLVFVDESGCDRRAGYQR